MSKLPPYKQNGSSSHISCLLLSSCQWRYWDLIQVRIKTNIPNHHRSMVVWNLPMIRNVASECGNAGKSRGIRLHPPVLSFGEVSGISSWLNSVCCLRMPTQLLVALSLLRFQAASVAVHIWNNDPQWTICRRSDSTMFNMQPTSGDDFFVEQNMFHPLWHRLTIFDLCFEHIKPEETLDGEFNIITSRSSLQVLFPPNSSAFSIIMIPYDSSFDTYAMHKPPWIVEGNPKPQSSIGFPASGASAKLRVTQKRVVLCGRRSVPFFSVPFQSF
jgi:hypothetical protein